MIEDENILMNNSTLHFKQTTTLFSTLNQERRLDDYDVEYKKYLYNLWKLFLPPLRARESSDVMLTLLATEHIGDEQMNAIKNAIRVGVNRRAVTYLTDTDLKLLGFTKKSDRKRLLQDLQKIPALELPYESVLEYGNKANYNNEIIINANEELMKLRYALESVYLKYKILPPSDSLLGEKWFASHFVLSTLEELSKASDELRKDLQELMVLSERKERLAENQKSKLKTIVRISLGCMVTLITAGCVTFLMLRLKK